MDEEKSDSFCKDEVSSESLDQTDFNMNPNIPILEVNGSQNEHVIMINEDKKPLQEKLSQSEIDSILLNNNDQKEYHPLIEVNSINSSIKGSTSLSNLLENNLLECAVLPRDAGKSQENSLLKSSSYSSIDLSNSFSYSPADMILNDAAKSVESDDYEELKLTPDNKEEILFNNTPSSNTDQTLSEEASIQNSIIHEKLMENIDRTEPLKHLKYEKIVNKDGQKTSQNFRNNRSQGNLIARPTLIDDSKLVKISLPTKPINIMQSNAQFLNKSRNFLNFITEKSSNIMEKALLPQHLSLKYNSVMKSVDNSSNEKKSIGESYSTQFPLPEPTNNTKSSIVEKPKDTLYSSNSQIDVQNIEKEFAVGCETKDNFVTNQTESICINTEKRSENSDQPNCSLSIEKQIEMNSDNKEGNTEHDIVHIEKNANCEQHNNSEVFNSECSSFDSETSKQSLLKHPAYLTMLKDYADSKANCLKLQEKVEYLEERNRLLEAENRGEIYALQIETLEKTINRLTSELHGSLESQENLKKEYSAANKERECMVMKYAVGEKQLIDTQRAREHAERKAKDSARQQELLQNKLREMQAERTRICNILDGKCREVTELQKEAEKLKEDVNMRDIKLKWTQNKLKLEMDTQKETQQKLDKATTRINEMKEECDLIRKETQETMRQFQQSEENKAVTLDQQLKEQQARLILERHVTEDKEMLRLQLQKEVETLKQRQQILIEENNTLSLKIQDAEKNRLNYESNLSNLKIIADQRQKEVLELNGKVSELETLKVQLQHKEQCQQSAEAEIDNLRLVNEELQADMYACRQKEAEMLDFTQKLTDKNVRLQLEFTAIEAKVKKLEEEHEPLHARIRHLMEEVKILEVKLAKEQETRTEESKLLAMHVAEQTQLAQGLNQKLEDSQGENAVLKRKLQLTMKEMTRELQQCRKKLEAYQSSSPCNSLGAASRAGSNISLNTGDTLNGALSDNSMNGDQNVQVVEPSTHTLMERIVGLQVAIAKKAERIEFLEDHNRYLTEEVQKKSKIIQYYILRENSGAMGSNERDRYKHIKSRRNAAELARYGGIMASIFTQRVSDEKMTLKLSLEINEKLQTTVEDTLLTNMTLKDNIDTLSQEIARLTMQNQQRQITN
ncbi:coiled-coil domain-containing protein 186 isoform X1 [Megalopta genalis]|uniref:coiled-coil domain-containing protein 186 isoform X1 n=1 Tax=Megalopta genalis TaxID=115081 RepID=UPI0014430A98|nr:coiled-coil domain-containing protein 186 isoform X1 [Megalopta genalis]